MQQNQFTNHREYSNWPVPFLCGKMSFWCYIQSLGEEIPVNVFQTPQYENKIVCSCRQVCRDAAHTSDHGNNIRCAESRRSYVYLTRGTFYQKHAQKSINLLEHFKPVKNFKLQTSLERILCKYSDCPTYREPPKTWSSSWFQLPLEQTRVWNM